MNAGPRRARVRALAKINLGLRVLGQRPDGYHELRTVFQTISLADRLEVEFEPARRTSLEVPSRPEISGNLVERAARLALEALRVRGRVRLQLTKRIPIGSGLGGGSSDAAAVLLALPVLTGRRLPLERLMALAAELGSDVPFFLLGGTAVALGRGTELYPLPETAPARGLLVAPDFQVATAEAYQALDRELTAPLPVSGCPPCSTPASQALDRELTPPLPSSMISSFQSWVWGRSDSALAGRLPAEAVNDFEPVVFARYPRLARIKRELERMGAKPAMLSGSGSAVFGLFAGPAPAERARRRFLQERVYPISLVSRTAYRRLWWRQLAGHARPGVWPPESRYAP